MFTGIVQAQGKIVAPRGRTGNGELAILLPAGLKPGKGESVAVNGVCLTVREMRKNVAFCDCMPETLRLTNLGELKNGDSVNLETPLTLEKPLGGHLVQGHVDGVGKILDAKNEGNAVVMRIKAPKKLCRYFTAKGSVAVDGVSLTITRTFKDGFAVSLIPETRKTTTLGRKGRGSSVNLEVDLIAKYVEKLVKGHGNLQD